MNKDKKFSFLYLSIFLAFLILDLILERKKAESISKKANYQLIFDKYNYWGKNKAGQEAFYVICESGYLASPRIYDLKSRSISNFRNKCRFNYLVDQFLELEFNLSPKAKSYPAYPVTLKGKLFFFCDGFFSKKPVCPASREIVEKERDKFTKAVDFSELEKNL